MVVWALFAAGACTSIHPVRMFTPWTTSADFMRQVARSELAIGIGGLLFRTSTCSSSATSRPELVWMTKILTDPFSDSSSTTQAPLALMKGELIDPGLEKHVKHAVNHPLDPSKAAMAGLSRPSTSLVQSFPGWSEGQTRNLEIPGSMLRIAE